MLIVTPNPALDRTLIVPDFRAGEIHRALGTIVVAGGKGLNAARAVRNLGGKPVCMGFIGGKAGRFFVSLAREEGFYGSWTSSQGETRTCYIVLDKKGNEPTVINESGPAVTEQCWDLLETDILATLSLHGISDGFVCFCGSLPPGAAQVKFGGLIRTLMDAGHAVWVDTSGEPLKMALDSAPAGIKVNAAEAGEALGRSAGTMEGALQIAEFIRSRGIQSVILTMGKNGALLANAQGAWRAVPPPVKAVTNVGSGDSFFGAFVLALEENKSQPDALCDGVAAGAANTLAPGGGNFTRAEFDEIRANVILEKLG